MWQGGARNIIESAVLVPAGGGTEWGEGGFMRGMSEYWRQFEEVGVYKYLGVLFGRSSGHKLLYKDRTETARQMLGIMKNVARYCLVEEQLAYGRWLLRRRFYTGQG